MRQIRKVKRKTTLCLVFIMIISSFSGCNTADGIDTTLPSPSDSGSITEADSADPAWMLDYPSILEEYRRFAECLLDEEMGIIENRLTYAIEQDIFSTPSKEGDLGSHWGCMQVETNIWYFPEMPKACEAFGYAIEDLNDDGNDELILLLANYVILAVFTTVDDAPVLVDAFWPRHRCAIFDSGMLYTLSSGGAGHWESAVQEIEQNGSALIPVKQFGCDVEFYTVIDGERVFLSETEFQEFRVREGLPVLSQENACEITKNSGIEFVPLFG